MKRSTFLTCMLLFGLLSILSLITLCLFSVLFHSIVLRNTRLDNADSDVYKQWVDPSVPIYLQFYFFNLTNPVEFKKGAKPRVVQQGPYTYRERRKKHSVIFHRENATVSYREVKEYYFESNLSVGLESDQITNVNLVYLALAQRINNLPKLIIKLIDWFERYFGEQLCHQRNVSELLWGYEDPLLRFLKNRHISVPSTRVGLYLDRNHSDGGVDIAVNTGAQNPNDFGRIMLYNGSRSLSCWTTEQANQINGTDGALFHPFMRPNEGFYVFAPDICRSIYFTPRSVVSVQGVPTVKYLPLEDTFDSPLNNWNNRGFCIHPPYCMKDGVLDMSTCQPGAPIVISMPHLVHADKEYLDAVEGLHPSEEFNTTFYVEPISGAVLKAAKKLQINANVSQNSKISSLSQISNVLLPIVYVNESVVVDAATGQLIRSYIYVLPFTVHVVAATVLGLSVAVLVLLGLVVLCQRKRRPVLPAPSQEVDETSRLLPDPHL